MKNGRFGGVSVRSASPQQVSVGGPASVGGCGPVGAGLYDCNFHGYGSNGQDMSAWGVPQGAMQPSAGAPAYGPNQGPAGWPGTPAGLYCGMYPRATGPVCTSIGIPETNLAGNTSVSVTINPVNPSQIRCIGFPSDIVAALVIDGFTIGGRSVFYGSIPARLFSEVSEDCSKWFGTTDVVQPGVGAVMTFRNTTAQPLTLRGAIGITELRC